MIEIKKYNNSDKQIWNEFVNRSRIDTFLFNRDFMDYHADRFQDHSFMIYRKGRLEGVLPGNIEGQIYYSHQGLTYGGLVTSKKMTISDVLQAFSLINDALKQMQVKEVIYKPTPYIYHLFPAQEDIYALYTLGAEKIGCNISSTILQENKISFTESRKGGIRKAKNENVIISESDNLEEFWKILECNLKLTYDKRPVHSISEIKKLKAIFPNQIKLFCAKIGGELIGGCLLFLMERIAHVQYISANKTGKENGALDLIFNTLIDQQYKDIPIFDFGQSTEHMGHYLNENLIFQKEGFGGRAVVYEIYKYNI